MEDHQDALQQSFRAAANSLSLLFKESVASERRARQAGYQACLEDLIKVVADHRARDLQDKPDRPPTLSADELLAYLHSRLQATRAQAPPAPQPSTPTGPAAAPAAQAPTPLALDAAAASGHGADAAGQQRGGAAALAAPAGNEASSGSGGASEPYQPFGPLIVVPTFLQCTLNGA